MKKKEYIELEIYPNAVYLDGSRFGSADEGKQFYDKLDLPYKVTFICGSTSPRYKSHIKQLFGVSKNATTT